MARQRRARIGACPLPAPILTVMDGEVCCFSGYTVLRAAPDGSLDGGRQGLFHRDTRVLSRHRLVLAGASPELVGDGQAESDRWEAVLRVHRPGGGAEGPVLPQDALGVLVRRRVGPGMLEEIVVRNHSAAESASELRIDVDADFADIAEVDGERRQRGEVTVAVDAAASRLELAYAVERDGRRATRGVRAEVVESTTAPSLDARGLRFDVQLAPRGEWRALVRYRVLDGDRWLAPDDIGTSSRARQRAAWRTRRPSIEAPDVLRRPFDRAADDLFDLRNQELEQRFLGSTRGDRWIVNAGVPTFTGLFGRDVLTAGWQSALLGPRAARGALEALAATQATTDDPWRDAAPGKLLHELREGPLVELGLSPRDAYYGSQTTPAMFVLALTDLWHWTGDTALLRRDREVAERAMRALERSDVDRDGLVEYEKRSPMGLRNQGWKDSDEAIRHADGTIATPPLATVEEQAFHYLALERMAELEVALGDESAADGYLARAERLWRRWHDAYWWPEEAFYALALEREDRQVRAVASNPGHALGAGIVPPEHAAAVADRLLAPDLFSGWGVRSLSDRHPSYNPFAYHLGAVWPVEQATFALGFKRYGLDRHLDVLVEGVLAAAAASPGSRLPEAITGHARSEVPAPVPYPAANSPQAWSASALVQLVQIMLGLYPFAPLRLLAVVRPRLPASVPSLTLRGVRVGPASVDLRFDRRADGSARWRVVGLRGRLVVVPAGPPDDPDGSWLERLEYGAARSARGRLARAGRLALGLR